MTAPSPVSRASAAPLVLLAIAVGIQLAVLEGGYWPRRAPPRPLAGVATQNPPPPAQAAVEGPGPATPERRPAPTYPPSLPALSLRADPSAPVASPGPPAERIALLALPPLPEPRATRHPIHFQTNTPDTCLPDDLKAVLFDVADLFGPVQVLSTHRDAVRNRRVGGAPHSFHLACQAIDFKVIGRAPQLLEYLRDRPEVGGIKRYPLGFFHIDSGPRRTW